MSYQFQRIHFPNLYFSQVYKSSSKRKVHILRNHPGQALPLSARSTSTASLSESNHTNATGTKSSSSSSNPTFSATVGSVTTQPHPCPFCHKQYASNAKLLQHQRKIHKDKLPVEKQVSNKFLHYLTFGLLLKLNFFIINVKNNLSTLCYIT